MANTPPADTLRDGNLKATIWRNEGEKGPYFTTTLSRSYKDGDGNYRDTQSFASSDLLRVSELARQAHNHTNVLKRDAYRDDDRSAAVEARLKERRAGRTKEPDRER